MKREMKYPETKTFHFYNANPKGRITGDCTFRAISTALGKPWEDVVMEMAKQSVETGYSVADKKGIERYLAKNGFVKMPQPKKFDNTKFTGEEFCKVQQRWLSDKSCHGMRCDHMTISPRIVANIGGNHIVAIMDGKVWDTWNSTDGCVGNYWVEKGLMDSKALNAWDIGGVLI